MLMLLYPLEDEIDGYSREQFLTTSCDECEKDIRQCFDAGAVRVSIDFTEGRLANKNDSRNPWTGKNMLQEFIDLNNRVFDRFSRRGAREHRHPHLPGRRLRLGALQGGALRAAARAHVRPERRLLPHPVRERGGQGGGLRLCGQYSRDDADGVSQVCFMGVINPLTPEVETAEQVRDDLVTAAKHIPVERLGATDDCGFSPFSRDVKPKHGSPDFARDVAMQKISARLEGARLASEELGV